MHFLFLFSLSSAGKRDHHCVPVYELCLLYIFLLCYSACVMSRGPVRTITGKGQCITVGETQREYKTSFWSADCCKKGNGTLRIKQEVTALILSWLRYRRDRKNTTALLDGRTTTKVFYGSEWKEMSQKIKSKLLLDFQKLTTKINK